MDHHKTPYKILTILQDGQFHSGESLGNTLKMTRSAIWKAIKQLTETGIDIKSVTGRGYCIQNGLSLLGASKIHPYLDCNLLKDIDLTILDQVTSTNDILLSRTATTPFQVVLAEQQTAGRGRHQRHWVSPYGHNMYCSVRWNTDKDPTELSGLSLVVAVAITRALKAYGINKQSIGLKWPNDVQIAGAKLAGTLIELKAESHSTTSAIIGMGINTHLSSQDADSIDQAWTALEHVTDQPIDRNHLAALLINDIIHALNQFSRDGLAPFLMDWSAHDTYLDQPVILTNGKHQRQGIYQGVTSKGELILMDESQQHHHIVSGEMSLRLC